jgi:type IV pilus assembly protein PilW
MNRIGKSGLQSRASVQGLSLIELMIAMLLGLLVVGAAIGIFLTNRRTYTATESLGRVQENVRTAFELMSRDVREATGNPCNSESNMAMVNVVNSPAAAWWKNWGAGGAGNALLGYGGATAIPGLTNRVSGTDALVALSGDDAIAVVTAHAPGAAQFTVSSSAHGFQPGQLLMVCGPNSEAGGIIRLGAIFSMTGAAGTTTIGHAASGGIAGNSTSNLGLGGFVFTFGPNSVITRLHSSRWYIGNNVRGVPSLYQSVLTTGGTVVEQEVAEGVQNMTLTYLLPGATSYVNAAGVGARWNEVTAVKIVLTLAGQDRDGTDDNALSRQLTHVATLRNRNP